MAGEAICSVLGCGKPARAGGMCSSHYNRFKRHGDPLGGRTARGGAIAELLNALDEETDDCVYWTKAKKPDGRGNVLYQGRWYTPARLICVLAHGEPPDASFEAAHSCGNGHLSCINKRHLRWATRIENRADSIAHGTQIRGERCHNARLTRGDIPIIRDRLLAGHTQAAIAKDFGVTQSAIWAISSNKNWRGVE